MSALIKKHGSFILICGLILFYNSGQQKTAAIQPKEVQVKALFFLENSDPKIRESITYSGSSFYVDEFENFYFLQTNGHRIIKTDIQGNIIGQYGQTGQSEADLYYPFGFTFAGETLLILNRRTKEIKILSGQGKFINSFKIGGVFQATSVLTDGKKIFTDIRYTNPSTQGNSHLIAVFTLEGKLVNKFGDMIRADTWAGYVAFNSIYLS